MMRETSIDDIWNKNLDSWNDDLSIKQQEKEARFMQRFADYHHNQKIAKYLIGKGYNAYQIVGLLHPASDRYCEIMHGTESEKQYALRVAGYAKAETEPKEWTYEDKPVLYVTDNMDVITEGKSLVPGQVYYKPDGEKMELKEKEEKKEKRSRFTPTTACHFKPEKHQFLWEPYLPIGEYTVIMAAGGTGKGVLTCGIIAAISAGKQLYGMEEKPKPRKVLIISAEDKGSDFAGRLIASGADMTNIEILDKVGSEGFNLEGNDLLDIIDDMDEPPALVMIDPWHAFVGQTIDVNRLNQTRPVFHHIAAMAEERQCAIVMISHVNKASHADNTNNSAMGSSDFINASRSAIQVITEDLDSGIRVMVHTKTNHASYGKSLRFRIIKDGGLEWLGTSNITRSTLEEAAAKKKKPTEIVREGAEKMMQTEQLLDALIDTVAKNENKTEINISYQELKDIYGEEIFWSSRPTNCLKDIAPELADYGITYKLNAVNYNGKTGNGIKILIDHNRCKVENGTVYALVKEEDLLKGDEVV